MIEKLYSPRQIQEICGVSYGKARQIIRSIMGDDVRMTPRSGKKRPYHLRRVPESLLKKHLSEFFNG
jgi:hypothetical protein